MIGLARPGRIRGKEDDDDENEEEDDEEEDEETVDPFNQLQQHTAVFRTLYPWKADDQIGAR
jgi:hypothetical protein